MVLWLAVLVALLFLAEDYPRFVCWPAAYVLIEVVSYTLCIIFVDRHDPNWMLRSPDRSLILLLVNYFEIVAGFAILYIATGSAGDCPSPFSVPTECTLITCPLDGFYFSLVTITTLGYGDFAPIGSFGRILSVLETSMGLIWIVVVIATFMRGFNNRHKRAV